jgi:tetratricopeptide (TPR) repeat protein
MKKIVLLTVLLLSACQSKQEIFLARAREQWRQDNYKASAFLYEQFLKLPDNQSRLQARSELANTYYLNLRNYPRAEFHYRMLLIEAKDEAASAGLTLTAHRRLAEIAVKSGRLDRAINEYEQLITRVPETEWRELRLKIANLYYNRNDLDQAELEYLKVVEASPYDNLSEEAYLRIAGIRHRFQQRYHEAVPIYEMIRANTKKESITQTACYGLAECYAADLQYTAAIDSLKQIQKRLSTDKVQQVRRQIKEYKMRRKQMAKLPKVDWSNPPQ